MVAIVETTKRTPPGKASRGTLAELVAKQKMLADRQGEFSGVQPIQSWTQGLAQVTGAVTTGLQQHQAEKSEAEGRAKLAEIQALVGETGATPQQLADMGMIDPEAAENYRQTAEEKQAAKRIADALVAQQEDTQAHDLQKQGLQNTFTTTERKGGETFTGGENDEERQLKITLQDNQIRATQEQAELEHKLKMLEPGSPGAKVIHDYQNGLYGPLGSVGAIKQRDADFNNATGITQAQTTRDVAAGNNATTLQAEGLGNASAEKIATGNNATTLQAEGLGNASAEKIATGNNATTLQAEGLGNASAEKIAGSNQANQLTIAQQGNKSAEGIAAANRAEPEGPSAKIIQDYKAGLYVGREADFKADLAKAQQLTGPSTIINNESGTTLKTEYYKAMGGKLMPAFQREAARGGDLTRGMDILAALDPTMAGPIAGNIAQMFPQLAAFDSQAQAFESVVKGLAPQQREDGSGSTSDVEYQGMLDQLPQLSNNPQAKAMIIEFIKARAAIAIERGRAIQEWQSSEDPNAQNALFAKMAELDNRSAMPAPLKAAIEAAQVTGGGDTSGGAAGAGSAPSIDDILKRARGG